MCPGFKYTFSGNFRVLVHLQQKEKKPKMDKNAILTAVYGIKICWMMTCRLELVHDSVTVPNCHCLTIFWQMQRFGSQKCQCKSFLRHFTNIYGNEMRLKPNSMFWNSVVCVSRVQIHIFWQFYGMKICWMMTDWLEFVHDGVSVPDYPCLTIFWQKQRFGSQKTVINANIKAFYGILRTFTAMKWDSNPTQCFETL